MTQDAGDDGNYLAGVEATFPPAGTDENVGYVLYVPRIPVHTLANGVIYYRHGHFL